MSKKTAGENPHRDHRGRMKERFLGHGLDSFAEHEALELLLYYAIPLRDVNGLAHSLIDTFGSLSKALDADYRELLKVEGMGEHSALLLKLIPEISRRYRLSRQAKGVMLNRTEDTRNFFDSYFFGLKSERVYAAFLDVRNKVLAVECLGEGDVSSAHISSRRLVELALRHNASQIILAHNHPSGNALPSRADAATTEQLRKALMAVGIQIRDHLIMAEDDSVSMADTGLFKEIGGEWMVDEAFFDRLPEEER